MNEIQLHVLLLCQQFNILLALLLYEQVNIIEHSSRTQAHIFKSFASVHESGSLPS
jgi:hypothetical protein